MREFDGRHGPVVVHCFTGAREELFDYLDRDWHVGITRWLCDERRGQHLREMTPNIPANRLMVETDAAYLMPRTLTPTPTEARKEPATLPPSLDEMVRVRGRGLRTTAATTPAATRHSLGS